MQSQSFANWRLLEFGSTILRDTKRLACLWLALQVLTTSFPAAFAADLPWIIGSRVNVSSLGETASNRSEFFDVSRNGRFVVFSNSDTSLVQADTSALRDVYVRDMVRNNTIRISRPTFGSSGISTSTHPSISSSGRFIAFASNSANLIGADADGDGHCDLECDTNGLYDIYVHDRDTDNDGVFDEAGMVSNTRVNVNSEGSAPSVGDSLFADISADGRHVLFVSYSAELVPDDTNGIGDLFVHDIFMSTTARVSISSEGEQANDELQSGFQGQHQISADGRYVAFSSLASNLVAGDTNFKKDVFVHDRDTDQNSVFDEPGNITTVRVSVDDQGGQLLDTSALGSISGNGELVSFFTRSANVVPDLDLNGLGTDVYLRDLTDASTERIGPSDFELEDVSCCSNATGRNQISGDGRFVSLTSTRNVMPEPGSTRGVSDAFVYDRHTKKLVQITYSPDPESRDDPDIGASVQAISIDGTRIIVAGELVEFLPPAIIQDEVLFVRNRIFRSSFE